MAGSSAFDGGRNLRAGLAVLGTLVCASPLMAQPASDPLAPLPTASANQQSTPAPPPPWAATSPSPAFPSAYAPKDWRAVFDAIDSGNWASAAAGIATLPPSVLTPVAKAELYTAKGS